MKKKYSAGVKKLIKEENKNLLLHKESSDFSIPENIEIDENDNNDIEFDSNRYNNLTNKHNNVIDISWDNDTITTLKNLMK